MNKTIIRMAAGALLFAASAVCPDGCLVAANQAATAAELSDELLKRVNEDPHVVACRKNREAVADNPYRPLYHFSAPNSLIHDPNGLCQWNGTYHLFYQYLISERGWVMEWGHAYSDDLVHWKDLPVGIKRTRQIANCWSGTTLVEKDRVVAAYFCPGRGGAIATASDPLLLDWESLPENPVIRADSHGSRPGDTCIWKGKDGYYYSNLMGGGRSRSSLAAIRSKDLKKWETVGELFSDKKKLGTGGDLSCPYFLPIGNGKHILFCFSHSTGARGFVGTYDPKNVKFDADYHFRACFGAYMNASLHAPSATIDEKGRCIAIFNMKEANKKKQEGWDGIMTLPRVYSLAKDNSLLIKPVPELEKIRSNKKTLPKMTLADKKPEKLKEIRGKAIELKVAIAPKDAKEFGLKVFESADGSQYTSISCNTTKGTISIDTSKDIRLRGPETAPLKLKEGEALELQIFVDRSIVEVFANGRQAISMRVYPTKEDASGVSLFSTGGNAQLLSLEAWQMRSVWPELVKKQGK